MLTESPAVQAPVVRPSLTRAQRAVRLALSITGPVTDSELVGAKASLPISDQSSEGISRRRRELVTKGYVEHVGDQLGPNGWPRAIWAVTQEV